jgi:3',5'-cyclic AMP phosphodiesterase CpdA
MRQPNMALRGARYCGRDELFPEDEPLIERITWLHVSDFHFKGTGDHFSETVACRALLTDVEARAKEHAPIFFVLVSGDIAFSGQPAEYERAAEFMGELSERLSIEPARFFFIPGNHDVDRRLHGFAHLGARTALGSQQAVDQALGDRARMSDLADRQRAYRAFVQGFTGAQERTETPDGLGYVAAVALEELTVAVVGLNSAWLCGSEPEERTLLIGERQVIAALESVRALDPQLVIAMAHHPLEWLTEWDQASCRARLLKDVHFLHRGHLHTADVSVSPQRDCVLVAAGSAHASRFHPNSYNIVSVDLASGTSLVAEYRYQVLEGTFQAAPVIHTPCELGGEIPGTAEELAGAMSAIAPEASRYAGYLAALLLGQKDEIPMVIDGMVMFVTPSLAAASDLEQAEAASRFLSLRNLLRIHVAGVSLSERIGEHSQRIGAFAAWLSERADMDDDCRERISDLPTGAPESGTSGAPASPHTAALLRELVASEDWELLESQAHRALTSSDQVLARLARRMLAEALMHSDEGPKRAQAAAIAGQLLEDDAAQEEEYLLAAAAFEVNGEPARAIALAGESMSRWPDSARLISYARDLVTRTGDVSLREAIEQAPAEVAHE